MIEFDNPEPGDGSDEDLPQPRQRDLPFGTRTRRVLTAVAGLAVVAAAVVYVQTSGTRDRDAARASKSSTSASPLPATVSPYTPGLLVEHLGDRNGTLRNDVEVSIPAHLVPPTCPRTNDGLAACAVHGGVPTAFAAAVHARFPTARHGTASTSILRPSEALSLPGMWTRTYRAQVGTATLRILVRRTEMDEEVAPVSVHFGSRYIVYVRHVEHRYVVEIQYTSGKAIVSQAALQALAKDARLSRP